MKIECPSIIQDGYPINITCTINKTDPVLKSCLSKNTRISITHNRIITLCSVPFDSQNCSSKMITSDCKCSRNTDDTFQYSYEYQVNKKRDENLSFRCDQICPGVNVPDEEFSSCTSIQIKGGYKLITFIKFFCTNVIIVFIDVDANHSYTFTLKNFHYAFLSIIITLSIVSVH